MHPMNDIATVRKVALYVGIPALAVAVAMTFQYGKSMSFLHAVCLGLLTIAGSIIWPYVKHIRTDKIASNAFRCVGALFLAVELFSHLGYTVGTRVMEAETTGITNAVYENNQAAAKDDAANLDLWRKQLSDLTAQNSWAATVKADALRSQLETADKAIANETARGGCKSKCLALMEKKADLEAKIATTEQVADLSKRIEATQRIIDGKRTEAAKTEFKSSAATNHNDTLFKAINMVTSGVFKQDVSMTEREATNTGIMGISSVAFLLLAPLFYFAAGLNRRISVLDDWMLGNESAPAGGTDAKGHAPTKATIINRTYTDRPLAAGFAGVGRKYGVV